MDDSITSQTLSSAAIVSHKWQYKQGSKGRVSFGEYGLSLSLSLSLSVKNMMTMMMMEQKGKGGRRGEENREKKKNERLSQAYP